MQQSGMNIRDLRETAELAHLNLGEDELQNAFGAFEEMLGFFAAMQAADSDPSSFAAQPAGASGMAASSRIVGAGYFRGDQASGGEGMGETLLEKAGERDGRFVVVPNVL